MKKKLSYLWIILLIVAVAATFTYRMMNCPPAEGLPLNAQVVKIFKDGGCISCHTENPDLPFYAEFPMAGDIVKADADSGYRAFDMAPMMLALERGELPHPVDMAKVGKVMEDQRMPMAKYYLVHWGSSTTDAKRDIILNWLTEYRSTYYADGLSGERAGEPIRPIATSYSVNEEKAKLGFMLYHDTRLSVDNTVSCASCHDLSTGGVDNKQYSEGVEGQKGGVNAPTVYNAVYNFVQFWDGRAKTLADQAAGPPLNPVEMASTSFDEIIAKLQQDREFVKDFCAQYPEGLTQATITDAIEQFEKTLITPNARFDAYLKGNNEAITAQELQGYEWFKKYDCATCHIGPNAGGMSYELMGLRKHYFADRGMELTNEDNGRYKETQQERDRHRFKVPGLRNVALTWPYYHDGTRATLTEAVRDMGTYQSGVSLSDEEVEGIAAFLRSLTGEYKGTLLTNPKGEQ